ncbi:FAD-binding domain-containing protein [Lindgomyces ingoldianus]|uniref:FAD-binding domain-containing protein n=1 Tax=Lindgomyces ingoldianus TaxID=673940 RepID=A0ACB6QJQ4_9PLEO|nr:FAD-binding domain-containing protein [Lindgomyces ingoldianus]KAF2467249.1 FAD-binding domain-containing protein [Lindgomyces ingoldianus]
MGNTPDVYAILKNELKGSEAEVLTPGSAGYAESIKRWSEHCEKKAQAVVKVTSSSDISKTLNFAQTNEIPFVVRGGGHSTSGSSSIDDGLVIDLSKMRKVAVDPKAKTIRAEGGTIWEDVDMEAAKFGLATVGGTVNHTDNLISVEIVLASGQLVTASESSHPDLFWAVRGAGQNFGVVTAFTFQGYDQPDPVFAGTLVFLPDKLPQIVRFVNKFHATSDGNQALLWGFSSPPPANAPVVLAQVFYNGSESAGQEFFTDLINLGPVANTTSMIPYEKLNGLLNHAVGFDGRKQFGGGAFKLPLNPAFVQSIHADFLDFVNSHERMNESLILFETIPFTKILEVSNEEMAFSNRGDYYNVATCFKWFDPSLDQEIRDFSRNLLKKASQSAGVVQDEKVRSVEGVGVYGNYANLDVSATDIYGRNAKKLEDLKYKYDPNNLFSRGLRLVPKPLVVVN